jgi:hypothetical protein
MRPDRETICGKETHRTVEVTDRHAALDYAQVVRGSVCLTTDVGLRSVQILLGIREGVAVRFQGHHDALSTVEDCRVKIAATRY